jgi:hypothetical protein
MKNNQNNKFFLNWASGTGGDFLIGMLHLLYPFPHTSSVCVNERNMWSTNNTQEYRLRMFECDDVNQIQRSLNDMNPGELFQYHQYLSQPLDIPKDILAVNLTTSDIYEESFIAHLYNIKARTIKSVTETSIVRQSTQIPGSVNVNYRTLFDNPTNDIAFNILNMFGRANAFSPAVVDCLKAYHQHNLKCIEDQHRDDRPQPFKKEIKTFQELCDHLEI